MIWTIALTMATIYGSAQAVPTDRDRNDAIFEASRARYFHALIAARKCEAVLPKQTQALEWRYASAMKALVEIHGNVVLGASSDVMADEPGQQSMCSGTLMGFDEKIAQIERRARQGIR